MANNSPGQDWLNKDLGELIDQLQLSDLQKRSLRSRWLDQVSWMEGKAGKVQKRYYALRLMAIIGGVIVPALVGVGFDGSASKYLRVATFLLGLAVAISVAVEEFFHYGERWRHYRSTAEMLKSEGWQFIQLSGQYKEYASHAEAYRRFADRIEQIINADVSKFITEVVTEKKDAKQLASEATEWRESLMPAQRKDIAAASTEATASDAGAAGVATTTAADNDVADPSTNVTAAETDVTDPSADVTATGAGADSDGQGGI